VGTGFIIGVPVPELGPGISISFLVTSKHLLRHQRLDAPKGTMEYFDTLTAMANTHQPNSEQSYIAPIPIPIKNRGFLACSIDNQDPDADVAVCFLNIPDTIFDFKNISPGMFATQSSIQALKINETDEVLFTGLFLPYHGAKKNYPIVRHGKLALIPKEKVPWSNPAGGTSMQDLYLAEVTSWGGNSGSPVFLRLGGAREQGGMTTGFQYLLLGVMQGYFNSERPATLDTAAITDTAHLDLELSENSGIAAIVPAQKILDIIGQPRTRAYVSIVKGMSYSKAGKFSDAESSFKDAIDTLRNNDPGHPLLREALTQYAEFLQLSGRFAEANFQTRQANAVNRISQIPDDQLK
jgi:hypothetical protein